MIVRSWTNSENLAAGEEFSSKPVLLEVDECSKWTALNEPRVRGPSSISVFKNSPNKEAATVFLNWFLSKEGQQTFVDSWAAFNKDPEWDALRKKYFVPLSANTFLMSATDYSPMK